MKKIVHHRRELKSLAKRLFSFLEKGYDKRSIEVRLLIQRIKFLVGHFGFKRRQVRRIFGTAALFLGLALTQNVHAQSAFTAPVTNPFNLSSAYQISIPVKADLDNDGDMDILIQEYTGDFKYYQNTGSATAPTFAAPLLNPFGLTAIASYLPKPTLADMDNDGDLDIMTYEYNPTISSADIQYIENTGTATAPAFAAPIINPFGIVSSNYFKLPTLADVDGDGDYDLFSLEYDANLYVTEFKYQENVGTATTPNFSTQQTNPFGLYFPSNLIAGMTEFSDVDGDGDLDMMMGEYRNNGDFKYYQNTGSASMPNFALPLTNPFGLIGVNTSTVNNNSNSPTFLDLDGDGDLDILSGATGGDLVYFENIFSSTGPLTVFNLTIGSPSCSPGGDGSLSALVGGGFGPITYKIGADSNTTGNFSNYTAGTYTLRVRDTLNTFIDTSFTISSPSSPYFDSLTSVINDISCFGNNDGLVFIAATGGTMPFTYSFLPISPVPSSTVFYNNLSAGNYTAIITDANNCVDSTNIIINEPQQLTLTLDSSLNINCHGGNTGSISTTTSGGSGGFIYTINPAGGVQTSPGDFTNLVAGNYILTCVDTNSCATNLNVTLSEPPPFVLNISSTQNASTTTSTDGSITSLAVGGLGNLTYSIAPNTGTQGPTGTFTGLGLNTYTVTVTDTTNCTASNIAIIYADTWPVAIDDIEKNKVKIYPNPFTNLVKLESAIEITSLTVLDVTGKIILELEQPEESISLQNLPTGIYVLKLVLKNEDTVYTRITKQ